MLVKFKTTAEHTLGAATPEACPVVFRNGHIVSSKSGKTEDYSGEAKEELKLDALHNMAHTSKYNCQY